jgi:type I restriction enzyme S subunit
MIADMKIYLPPTKKEQTTIALILSDMDLKIKSLENKKVKYQEIKQGMMQELLTGKTRLV